MLPNDYIAVKIPSLDRAGVLRILKGNLMALPGGVFLLSDHQLKVLDSKNVAYERVESDDAP